MNAYRTRKRMKSIAFSSAFYLLLIGLMYIFLFPLLTIVIAAIQDPSSVMDPTVMWVPKKLSLEPLKKAMELMHFWPAMGKSLLITLLSTAGTCISCSLAAYGLSRYKFPGRNLLFGLAVLTIVVPPVILTNPAFVNFRYFNPLGIFSLTSSLTGIGSVNLLDTIWTFVFPAFLGVGLRGGLFIFIFRQFFFGRTQGAGGGSSHRWMRGVTHIRTYHCTVGGTGICHGHPVLFHMALERLLLFRLLFLKRSPSHHCGIQRYWYRLVQLRASFGYRDGRH